MGLDDTIAYVDREVLEELGVDGNGFFRIPEQHVYDVIERRQKWGVRGDLEDDPSKKQIIPYCAVLRRSDPSRVFTYERKKGGNEERLHLETSIGFGGHVDERERDGEKPLPLCGLRRELEEELDITGYGGAEYLGLINWDADEVGRVHLGIAYRLRVADAHIREMDKLEGCWGQLVRDPDNGPGVSLGPLPQRGALEDWSSLLCAELVRWLEGHASHEPGGTP